MNMLHCLRGTGFHRAAALAAFALFLSCPPAPAAPAAPGPGDPVAVVPAPGTFRALSYLKADARSLMVHLENPRREQVTVLVLNAHQEVVYRKAFGQPAAFAARFNLTGLPNGEYTFLVQGGRGCHTRTVLVQTHSERVLSLR
jgi:hypothetical protein